MQAAFVHGTSYLPTGVGLLLFGLGAGIAMSTAIELIMATLPPARAGVGSAVNDTVRELGAALDVNRHLGTNGAEVAAPARGAFVTSMTGYPVASLESRAGTLGAATGQTLN